MGEWDSFLVQTMAQTQRAAVDDGHEDGHNTEEEVAAETLDRLSKDELFHVLQNERRRNALRCVSETETPIAIRDLADQVAALETGSAMEELSSDERQRAYISLYQTHLPKLDDVGVVDYDQDAGTIERTSMATQVDRYLDDESVEQGEDGQNWWDTVRSTWETPATLVGGAMLGASAGTISPLLFLGITLVFTTLMNDWVLETVTNVGA